MSALSNARWLIVIQGYKIILQLVGMSVLTRLLPPSDYGLMAMAWTAANLASLLKDMGMSSAIIQKQELSEQTKSTIFWMQFGLGTLLALILIAASGAVSAGFKQPGLQPILCLLALTFPIGSLSAVHQALLERHSGFRTLARIEIVASSVSLLVAVVSALNGAGVYAFVWQSFTTTILYVVQPWLALRWRPQFTWHKEDIRSIFGFSGNLSAFNLINFIARNADSAIVGRFLGATALGTYSMAYKLMLFPLQNLTFVAGRALFPIMSRQQDDNAELSSLYVRALTLVAAISTPTMAGLYVLREPLALVMFGQQWGDVAHVIQWLAPVGAFQAIVSTTGTIYMAKGRTDILFKLGGLSAVLTIVSFFVGLSGGIVGVAACYLAANVITFFPHTYVASRLIRLDYSAFIASLLPSLVCTALMMPCVYFAAREAAAFGHIAALLAGVAAGVVSYLACYFVFYRRRMHELLKAVLGARFAPSSGAAAAGPAAKRLWLFVDLAENFGGHEVMLLRWIDELQSAGKIAPALICLRGTRLAAEAAGRCELIELAGVSEGGGRLARIALFARLVYVLTRTKLARAPELAVVAEGSLFAQRHGLYAARLARLYTVLYVPLVSSFSSMGFAQALALEKKLKNFYGKLPHAWLTITPDQAEEFRHWSQVKQQIFTLPNTVQVSIEQMYAQGLDTRKPSPGSGPLHVLVLGRLDAHQKGLDLLLAYLKRSAHSADEFVFHFTGEGPYGEVLLEEKRLDDRLDRLITVESWASPLEIFRQSDVLLIPSRYEGVPLVMLEAMAFGLPVLASDLAGTRAYLPRGCLFPVGEFDRAFACLRAMRNSGTRATRIARRNLVAFKRSASGSAFTAAVDDLTAQLCHAAQPR